MPATTSSNSQSIIRATAARGQPHVPAVSVKLDQIASLPSARLCKEAWPLLRAEQRARSAVNPSSARGGATHDGECRGGGVPHSSAAGIGFDARNELDEASLVQSLNAAADTLATCCDPLTTVQPLRLALYASALSASCAEADVLLKTSSGKANVSESSESAGTRARATTAARGRRTYSRRSTARGGSSAAAAAQPAPAAPAVTAPQTISILLTCPTSKRDDSEVLQAIAKLLHGVGGDAAGVADVQSLVDQELSTLIQLCAGSRGPKFHNLAAVTVGVVHKLALLATVPETNNNAGYAAMAVLHSLQRTYHDCPPTARALPELWYPRVITPVLYLFVLFQWSPQHLVPLSQLLVQLRTPTEEELRAVSSLEAPPAAVSKPDGNNTPEDKETVVFDEVVVVEFSPSAAPGGSSSMSQGPDAGPKQQTNCSWFSLVEMPYATKVSVQIHTATRCEGIRLMLIPSRTTLGELPTCLAAVEPRVAHVLHEPGSVLVRCPKNAHIAFHATVVGTVSLTLNTDWQRELRDVHAKAVLDVVESLLREEPSLPASKHLFPVLNSGTRRPRANTDDECAAPPCPMSLSEALLQESDAQIARTYRCRLSDAPKIRPLLAVTAHLLHRQVSAQSAPSELWSDVTKKVALYTDRLVSVTASIASDVAAAIVETSEPPTQNFNAMQAIEASLALLSRVNSGQDVRDAVASRSAIAVLWLAGLNLLTAVSPLLGMNDMHHVARLCRAWMSREQSHYLSRACGCGEAMEAEIRSATHRTISFLFQVLSVNIRRIASSSSRQKPHRYVVADTEHGALMILSLSILTAPLDTRDVVHISQSRIADQLLQLLPNFTDFSRSNSFSVEESAEGGMASLLQALIDQWSFVAQQPLLIHNQQTPLARRSGTGQQSHSNNSLPNAQRGRDGAWMIAGSRVRWHLSKEPAFDTTGYSLGSARGAAFVEVTAKCASKDLKGVHVCFLNPTRSGVDLANLQRAMPQAEDTLDSFFFGLDGQMSQSDGEGTLSASPWLPVEEGDTVGFGFTFSSRLQQWQLFVWHNGLLLGVFPVGASQLYLGVGVADRHGATAARASLEVAFSPSALHEKCWQEACAQAAGRGQLPTLHEVTLFASHAFHILMSRCSRAIAKWRQNSAAQTSHSAPQSPVSANSAPIFKEFTLSALVERGGELLCANIEAILRCIKELHQSSIGASEPTSPEVRVKVAAAMQVYRVVLLYLMGTLRVVSRVCGYTADAFLVLASALQCCSSLDAATVAQVLTQLMQALDDSTFVAQHSSQLASSPAIEELWCACRAFGECTTANDYQPLFCDASLSSNLVITEGGRSVAPSSGQRHQNARSAAVAVPGLQLLSGLEASGTSGADVVTFSVRLQRAGRNSGTLGRYYFVGLIGYKPNKANSLFTDYTRNMSERCFLLPDFASELAAHANKAEAERYRRNWMSADGASDAVIYGSGDLITVTVDRRRRTVSFQRNGLPLGTLYSDVGLTGADTVQELYPIVCLYNGDATAALHFRPSETGIRGRAVMRRLLSTWPMTVVPLMMQLLERRNPLALKVLQSDGNDFSFLMRGGQSGTARSAAVSDLRQRPRCTMQRMLGEYTEVVDADGRHRFVQTDSLKQDFGSAGSPTLLLGDASWVDDVVNALVDMVTGSVLFDGESCVCVMTPRATIRALRLLSQLPFHAMQRVEHTKLCDLLSTLKLLSSFADQANVNATPSSPVSAARTELSPTQEARSSEFVDSVISSAWSELDTLDEDQAVFQKPAAVSSFESSICDAAAESSSSCMLLCPECLGNWGTCQHAAPLTVCDVYHKVLTGRQRPSPYTAWSGDWSAGDIQLSLHGVLDRDDEVDGTTFGKVDVEGSGEDVRGRFRFRGVVVDGYRVSGKITYASFERADAGSVSPTGEEEPEEWPCEACTLLNPRAATRCGACGSGKPGSCWACAGCTYAYNSTDSLQCMLCGTRRVIADASSPDSSTSNKARCVDCCTTRTFPAFESFTRYSDCPTCRRRTAWLPEETFSGLLHATLTTEGDTLDVCFQIRNDVSFASLQSHQFSLSILRDCAKEALQVLMPTESISGILAALVSPAPTVPVKATIEAASRGFASQAPSASRAGGRAHALLSDQETILRMLGARLGLGLPESPTDQRAQSPVTPPHAVDASHSGVRTAVQVLASRAICVWLPGLIEANVLPCREAAAYFLCLRASSDEWLDAWRLMAPRTAELLVEGAIHAFRAKSVPPSVALALTTPCLRLIQWHGGASERLRSLLPLLIHALAHTASEASRDDRDLGYRALLLCLEHLSESDKGAKQHNTSAVQKLLSQKPVLLSQQQLAIFASLNGTESGKQTSAVIAAYWVIHAVTCITLSPPRPLPVLFDTFHQDHCPHLVVLPDTKLNDGGDLMVGQLRGSVAVHPNHGGKYYYEIVLPHNFSDRMKAVVMGWGSRLHEIQGSSQHVGSDLHSWGFNGRNRVRLLTGEHEIAVARYAAPGDTIGALLDLDRKQMCWSVNGEELQWLDIPLQGDGEPIYPYISASTEPAFVQVRLSETQFLPDGYTDFRNRIDGSALRSPSAQPPQSYAFYKQCTELVNELGAGGLSVDALLQLQPDDPSDWVDRVSGLLSQFPLIAAAVASQTADGRTLASAFVQHVVPFIRHLHCLSAMAAVIAKRTETIRDSPYLWRRYQQAKDLLFFSARWALVDVHLSRRLNRSGDRRVPTVVVDRMLAHEAHSNNSASAAPQHTAAERGLSEEEEEEDASVSPAASIAGDTTARLLRNSITGQVFHAMKTKDAYTQLVMFTVQIRDSITEDAGGVTRSIVSMMCDELMWSVDERTKAKVEPLLPLFCLTDHSTYFNVVPNMAWLSRLSADNEVLVMQMYEWLGKLFGNAVLAGTLVYSLSFPRLVWKFLVHEECTIEDYFMDCSDSARGALQDDAFLMDDAQFFLIPGIRDSCNTPHHHPSFARASSSTGLDAAAQSPTVDGLPFGTLPTSDDETLGENGASLTSTEHDAVTVSPSDPMYLLRVQSRRAAATRALLHQYDKVLERLRAGFESVVPPAAVEQMRWDDVRQRVCGSDAASPADILSNLDMTSLTQDMVRILSDTIHSMTPSLRSRFLLFATGQRRLPVPEKVRVTCGDQPNELPTAHTCSPISLKLPPCSSGDELMKKLQLSLAHVYEFGFV